MIFKFSLSSFVIFCLSISSLLAMPPLKDTAAIKKIHPPVQKFYVGNSFDGLMFSTATIKEGAATSTGTVRFSWFINAGVSLNYNFNKFSGVFTGLDLKNIGYIDRNGTENVVKRRTYNLGIPVGLKIGNMARKGAYAFFGTGIDMPVNYKEKNFVIRSQKIKFNEWFSKRTPALMPYVFAGFAFSRGITLKAQYYPNNFMNPDFTFNGAKIYEGEEVHIIALSIGVAMRYGKKPDLIKKRVTELNTM